MSADELRSDDVALSLGLVIAGITTRYVSHAGWPAASGLTDHVCLSAEGATMGGTLSVLGGAAEYRQVTLQLATLGPLAESDRDPGLELGATDWRDCTAAARLITSLAEETGTATVEIDRDPAPFGMGAGGYIHIARECIQVTGTAGDGTIGNPWRFTLGARGARSTLPQQHYVSAVEPMRPWVTSDPFAWRWRRAWLYARARRPNGTFGDLVLAMPGFIGGPPVIDSGVVSVQLLPLTAILDKKLAGQGGKIRLLQHYHYFADGVGCTIEHAQRVRHGGLYDEQTTVASAAGSTVLDAPTGPYDACADVTLPSGHPRHTRLDFHADRGAEPTNPHAGVGQFQLAAGLPVFLVPANSTVSNVPEKELHQVDLISPPVPGTTALLRWPVDALDAINAAWAFGTYTGLGGAWCDVGIGDDAERGPHITVKFNVEQRHWPISLHFWSGEWFSSAAEWSEPAKCWASGAPVGPAALTRQMFYGIDFRSPDSPAEGDFFWRVIDADRDSSLREQWWPIRGWATAFYQGASTNRDYGGDRVFRTGERYILADSDVFVPPGGSAVLAISYTPKGGGDRQTAACRIISSAPQGNGFALEVHPDDRETLPSFGDWGEGEPVTMTPAVKFADQDDAFLLLELLHSNGGNRVSDANFDVHAFGGGLATADVEQGSFTRHPTAPGLDRWSPWIQPGQTLREVVDPILVSTASGLVMQRTAAGDAQLARISMGLESLAGTSDHLDEWETAQPPANAPDDVVTNLYTFRLNHRAAGLGDAASEETYTDAASVAAHGDGEELVLELRGLYTDPRDAGENQAIIRDMVARFSTIAGSPRVRWVGRVPIGDVWTLDLGSEVLVTSPQLKGRGKAWGVAGLTGRIVHIGIPLWSHEATAEVGIVHYGINATRWNAALEVTAVAGNVCTVAANTFASVRHPITGAVLQDLDGMSVGDKVFCRPRYDHDAAGAAPWTIAAINRTTRAVTLDAPPGFGAPDFGYIEPATYPDSSTTVPPSGITMRVLAWLADLNGRLNGGALDGQDLL